MDSSDDESYLDDCEDLLLLSLRKRQNRRKSRRRRFWVRDIFRERPIHGTFHTLFQTLLKDNEMFFRYHRMTPSRFEHLLSLIQHQCSYEIVLIKKCTFLFLP